MYSSKGADRLLANPYGHSASRLPLNEPHLYEKPHFQGISDHCGSTLHELHVSNCLGAQKGGSELPEPYHAVLRSLKGYGLWLVGKTHSLSRDVKDPYSLAVTMGWKNFDFEKIYKSPSKSPNILHSSQHHLLLSLQFQLLLTLTHHIFNSSLEKIIDQYAYFSPPFRCCQRHCCIGKYITSTLLVVVLLTSLRPSPLPALSPSVDNAVLQTSASTAPTATASRPILLRHVEASRPRALLTTSVQPTLATTGSATGSLQAACTTFQHPPQLLHATLSAHQQPRPSFQSSLPQTTPLAWDKPVRPPLSALLASTVTV